MLYKLAYVLNRQIKNPKIYNFFSRGFHFYQDIKKMFKYGHLDIFSEIDIELISMCNRKCHYCPVSKYNRGSYQLTKTLFNKIINDLKSMNYKSAITHHFYSEPLLNKNLEEFVKYEKEHLPACKIIIFTNGDLLTRKRFDALTEAGVDFFYVTMHRGTDNKKLIKMYSKLDFSSKKKLLIRKLSMNHALSNRGGLVHVRHKEIKRFCAYPSNILTIDVHGNVILCCEDFFGKYKWGNVKKESIKDIWNKSKYRKARKQLMQGKFPFDICKYCTEA